MAYLLLDHPKVVQHFDADLLYGFDLCVTELTMENFMRWLPQPTDLLDGAADDHRPMISFLQKYQQACDSRNQRKTGLLDYLKRDTTNKSKGFRMASRHACDEVEADTQRRKACVETTRGVLYDDEEILRRWKALIGKAFDDCIQLDPTLAAEYQQRVQNFSLNVQYKHKVVLSNEGKWMTEVYNEKRDGNRHFKTQHISPLVDSGLMQMFYAEWERCDLEKHIGLSFKVSDESPPSLTFCDSDCVNPWVWMREWLAGNVDGFEWGRLSKQPLKALYMDKAAADTHVAPELARIKVHELVRAKYRGTEQFLPATVLALHATDKTVTVEFLKGKSEIVDIDDILRVPQLGSLEQFKKSKEKGDNQPGTYRFHTGRASWFTHNMVRMTSDIQSEEFPLSRFRPVTGISDLAEADFLSMLMMDALREEVCLQKERRVRRQCWALQSYFLGRGSRLTFQQATTQDEQEQEDANEDAQIDAFLKRRYEWCSEAAPVLLRPKAREVIKNRRAHAKRRAPEFFRVDPAVTLYRDVRFDELIDDVLGTAMEYHLMARSRDSIAGFPHDWRGETPAQDAHVSVWKGAMTRPVSGRMLGSTQFHRLQRTGREQTDWLVLRAPHPSGVDSTDDTYVFRNTVPWRWSRVKHGENTYTVDLEGGTATTSLHAAMIAPREGAASGARVETGGFGIIGEGVAEHDEEDDPAEGEFGEADDEEVEEGGEAVEERGEEVDEGEKEGDEEDDEEDEDEEEEDAESGEEEEEEGESGSTDVMVASEIAESFSDNEEVQGTIISATLQILEDTMKIKTGEAAWLTARRFLIAEKEKSVIPADKWFERQYDGLWRLQRTDNAPQLERFGHNWNALYINAVQDPLGTLITLHRNIALLVPTQARVVAPDSDVIEARVDEERMSEVGGAPVVRPFGVPSLPLSAIAVPSLPLCDFAVPTMTRTEQAIQQAKQKGWPTTTFEFPDTPEGKRAKEAAAKRAVQHLAEGLKNVRRAAHDTDEEDSNEYSDDNDVQSLPAHALEPAERAFFSHCDDFVEASLAADVVDQLIASRARDVTDSVEYLRRMKIREGDSEEDKLTRLARMMRFGVGSFVTSGTGIPPTNLAAAPPRRALTQDACIFRKESTFTQVFDRFKAADMSDVGMIDAALTENEVAWMLDQFPSTPAAVATQGLQAGNPPSAAMMADYRHSITFAQCAWLEADLLQFGGRAGDRIRPLDLMTRGSYPFQDAVLHIMHKSADARGEAPAISLADALWLAMHANENPEDIDNADFRRVHAIATEHVRRDLAYMGAVEGAAYRAALQGCTTPGQMLLGRNSRVEMSEAIYAYAKRPLFQREQREIIPESFVISHEITDQQELSLIRPTASEGLLQRFYYANCVLGLIPTPTKGITMSVIFPTRRPWSTNSRFMKLSHARRLKDCFPTQFNNIRNRFRLHRVMQVPMVVSSMWYFAHLDELRVRKTARVNDVAAPEGDAAPEGGGGDGGGRDEEGGGPAAQSPGAPAATPGAPEATPGAQAATPGGGAPMAQGRARTIEEVRREFGENRASFELVRGFSECRFCKKWGVGFYGKRGQDDNVCQECIAEPEAVGEAQAAKGGKAVHATWPQFVPPALPRTYHRTRGGFENHGASCYAASLLQVLLRGEMSATVVQGMRADMQTYTDQLHGWWNAHAHLQVLILETASNVHTQAGPRWHDFPAGYFAYFVTDMLRYDVMPEDDPNFETPALSDVHTACRRRFCVFAAEYAMCELHREMHVIKSGRDRHHVGHGLSLMQVLHFLYLASQQTPQLKTLFAGTAQHDAGELMISVVNVLDGEKTDESMRIFAGTQYKTVRTSTCFDANHVGDKSWVNIQDGACYFTLNLGELDNNEKSIDDYLIDSQEEFVLEGENARRCEACHKETYQAEHARTTYDEFATFYTVELQNVHTNEPGQSGRVNPNLYRMSIQQFIDLPQTATPDATRTYELFAVIHHHPGHYIAFVKMRENWIKCNDVDVSLSDFNTATSSDENMRYSPHLIFYRRTPGPAVPVPGGPISPQPVAAAPAPVARDDERTLDRKRRKVPRIGGITEMTGRTKVMYDWMSRRPALLQHWQALGNDKTRKKRFWLTMEGLIQEANKPTPPVRTLRQGENVTVALPAHVILTLMAHAFFGIFDGETRFSMTNVLNGHTGKRALEKIRGCEEKIKCIWNYFEHQLDALWGGADTEARVRLRSRQVIFSRAHAENVFYENESAILKPMVFYDSKANGSFIRIEDVCDELAGNCWEVDFANPNIGGGALGHGLVQEEIRFLQCPELMVSTLFVDAIGDTECIRIEGYRQFNVTEGYAGGAILAGVGVVMKSFAWVGSDTSQGTFNKRMIVIDAVTYKGRMHEQFNMIAIDRELHKAYVGFATGDSLPISTGHWGGGAFCGNKQLKAVIQMLAAAMNEKQLHYCVFGDDADIPTLAAALEGKTVADVYKGLRDVIDQHTPESFLTNGKADGTNLFLTHFRR